MEPLRLSRASGGAANNGCRLVNGLPVTKEKRRLLHLPACRRGVLADDRPGRARRPSAAENNHLILRNSTPRELWWDCRSGWTLGGKEDKKASFLL
eukprot:CAMPEP_0114125390 /NCGR_PEP_ID=MMETSP0043_2-20121206/9277_1 /TAXON_ID=464988 /ORGANISM="Hemiselmis andersenii, Strain CCMP644" /LENGTH=95 /DNA_ID=CAMNT_0001218317 /DNA_START=435 /DNA_END=722 /DNA_ORIENTATION=+